MVDVLTRSAGSAYRLAVFCVVAALVLVPTVMRARQHVDRHETTRLSIRLNWQSDTPPRTAHAEPDRTDRATGVPSPLSELPFSARVAGRVHPFDEPVVQLLFDNSPDLLRGPPALIA